MHDIRWIRENPEAFDRAMARRGESPVAAELLAVDEKRRSLQTELQTLQQNRNAVSKQIGAAKKSGDNAETLVNEVAAIKARMTAIEDEERLLGDELSTLLGRLPNIMADDVPDGADEDDNVEVRRVGEPKEILDARDHMALGEGLGLLDFKSAVAMSGSRFVLLRGGLAQLERALGQFMLDVHVAEHGFDEIQPPYLVGEAPLYGTGQLPKFGDDLFKTTDDRWLIPTSEVPLTNMVADRILTEGELPLRLAALTPCFRSEAGAAGRDTRGLIRMHQFNKVEMVCITAPEDSDTEQQRMLGCAETVLQRLGLAYRIVNLCSGDIGFSARRTFDVEVWMPGQARYREISSVSTTGDFQARRMNARMRKSGEKATQFVHTLNGSGVAVGRALIAVMETFQQPNGSIIIPEVLRPYMRGREVLGAE